MNSHNLGDDVRLVHFEVSPAFLEACFEANFEAYLESFHEIVYLVVSFAAYPVAYLDAS